MRPHPPAARRPGSGLAPAPAVGGRLPLPLATPRGRGLSLGLAVLLPLTVVLLPLAVLLPAAAGVGPAVAALANAPGPPSAPHAPGMPGTTPSGTGTVTGTVTGEGRPLPFATVRLVPVATAEGAAPLPPLVTRTDGLGRYRFGQLPPTAAQLRAEAPPGSGLVDTSWPRAHTRAEAGVLRVGHGPVLADLDLPRGGTVAGQVVDADTGAPVPGAVVRATARAGWMVEEVGAAEGTGDGGFLITGLPPRPLRLAVRLPGTSPYLGPWFWTAEGQRAVLAIDGRAATDDVTIRLERGAEVRGTVRDDAGSPVAGALVGVRGCVIGCPVAVPTDERGRYRIVGIPPGDRLTVSTWLGPRDTYLRWYGRAPASQQSRLLSLAAGEALERVDLTLPRGAEVRLRVLDGDRPLPDVVVQLRPAQGAPDAGGFGPRRNFGTRDPVDPTRRLLGPVPPGRYDLVILSSTTTRDCRPDVWVGSSGVAPDGAILLGPGDRMEATVQLDCSPPAAPAPAPAPAAPAPASPGATPTEGAGPGAARTEGARSCRGRAAEPAQPPRWPWPSPLESLRELPAWARVDVR